MPESLSRAELGLGPKVLGHPGSDGLRFFVPLTNPLEWETAGLRLAESLAAGPVCPEDSESMPEEPRADLSLSAVGGHQQAV